MRITVINLSAEKYLPRVRAGRFVYIGRSRTESFHYGNPFTHLAHKTLADVRVGSREAAVQAYRDWLAGTAWQAVQPERRAWILAQIQRLADAGEDLVLACFCVPALCHGAVLRALILAAAKDSTDDETVSF